MLQGFIPSGIQKFASLTSVQTLRKAARLRSLLNSNRAEPFCGCPVVAMNGNCDCHTEARDQREGRRGGSGEGRIRMWFEEELESDLRWVFGVKSIIKTGVSSFQDFELLDSGPFGKVLILDGKMQSAEADEFVYHESLVHPAMLHHPNPQHVFIMGGGEGSTARELLKHRSVQRVDMCDIDGEVVDFCRKHLTMNSNAFSDSRLNLIINDAKEELSRGSAPYDVIVGDLCDPVEDGPCYTLYTQAFYANVLKPRLGPGGIFVTQAGPAGILSAREVYSPIFNTLRQVFKYVVPYAAHLPSYGDTWGWIMASDSPLAIQSAAEVDSVIEQRVDGELRFLDGATLLGITALNKHIRSVLEMETTVYTEDNPLFIHGRGIKSGTSQ